MAMSKEIGGGALRGVGGISGAGEKYVNPTYRQMIKSKSKKEAAGFTVGAGATATWVGSEIKEERDRYKAGQGNSWKKVEMPKKTSSVSKNKKK
jgi:hypothetical protein